VLEAVLVVFGVVVAFGVGVWGSFIEAPRFARALLELLPLVALTALAEYVSRCAPEISPPAPAVR
jgi:hypothetical protein